ncbi:DoxX family membrane protein [Paramicrobacterium fandaimingii]|uniref:DoxX family membrane protein n=1 Tax=Paramicrobacterium fandaimingii TaxID=2708079 RepID=UPI001423B8FA|nr:DoxX family membrane protein [Microbacterium fandaimingii]
MTAIASRVRAAPVLVGAARIVLGLLWLNEGITKYRAGFGSADIALVAESAASNSRVPAFFQRFAESVLGGFPCFFGVVVPFLEVGLGVALVVGVLTLPAALGGVGTLVMYWLSDQLIAQYPIMTALAGVLLVWPLEARRYGLATLLVHHVPLNTSAARVLRGRLSRWT